MFRIFCIATGYLIGCIQTAFIVSKFWHVDLRTKGSGNLGTTNALRVLGKRAGAMTFVGDIMKSVGAFFICRAIFGENGNLAGLYGSVGAILGHNYPFYLQFKGGKGIAVMIGMTLALAITVNPWVALPTAVLGFGAVFVTGYVSLGSLLFSAVLPVSCWYLGFPAEMLCVLLGASMLAFWRHRVNIQKLLNGTENKFGAKKK